MSSPALMSLGSGSNNVTSLGVQVADQPWQTYYLPLAIGSELLSVTGRLGCAVISAAGALADDRAGGPTRPSSCYLRCCLGPAQLLPAPPPRPRACGGPSPFPAVRAAPARPSPRRETDRQRAAGVGASEVDERERRRGLLLLDRPGHPPQPDHHGDAAVDLSFGLALAQGEPAFPWPGGGRCDVRGQVRVACGCPKLCTQPSTCRFAANRRPA